ncbi:MAG TPA: hypothetical protein VN455_05670 [Methanotrichaceae archaeon]|nr:hypothetical protein [Methanotrichaceae archaeon]
MSDAEKAPKIDYTAPAPGSAESDGQIYPACRACRQQAAGIDG